jgi:hypothetical protein
MSNLSASGVRLVLGPLLKSLSGSDWRRKRGGVELLGSMAFISPTQLSSCLPSIVPVLTSVLGDTHVKVGAVCPYWGVGWHFQLMQGISGLSHSLFLQLLYYFVADILRQQVQEAAREALQNIGGVISNPEIKQHVGLVLQSFNDPDRYTEPLLRALLNTSFVHVIDAPSLALLMPAVTRALGFRAHEAKLMAAQIVGNIGSLTKPADLAPYLSALAEALRLLLIDASPEVRLVAARAWGNLLRGMGEAKFPDLVAWLFENFESAPNQSTRAGSAQGLGEVLASVPQERFDVLVTEVLDRTDHVSSGVRQGAMLTVAYLPASTVGAERVRPRLSRLIDLVLRGLADDQDEVHAYKHAHTHSFAHSFHSFHSLRSFFFLSLTHSPHSLTHASHSLPRSRTLSLFHSFTLSHSPTQGAHCCHGGWARAVAALCPGRARPAGAQI